MTKNKLLITALSSAFLFAGCKDKQDTLPPLTQAVAEDDVIATVNGRAISNSELAFLNAEVAQRGGGGKVGREQLVNELISRELLYQEAEKNKLGEQPDVALKLSVLNRTVLSQAAAETYLKKHKVTDEQIKQAYDKQTGGINAKEYKARHILTESEEEARKVIAELDKGGNFADLAKKHSKGPTSVKGGDLGWFAPNRMVPEFSESVIAMENGKYTNDPVKTQFGWHVILREDARSQKPPPLEEAKPQIKTMIQRQALQEYITGLKNGAEIDIKDQAATKETKTGETPK